MVLGRSRDLSPGRTTEETDLLVLTSGICTQEALRALPAVRERGVSVRHLHISTLKPFDDPAVLRALRHTRRGVITLENHLTVGGLGSAVSETMTDHGIGVPLTRMGLNDTYAHGASQKYLTAEYGLDAAALVRSIGTVLGTDLGIREDEYVARLESTVSDAKADQL